MKFHTENKSTLIYVRSLINELEETYARITNHTDKAALVNDVKFLESRADDVSSIAQAMRSEINGE